MATYNELYQISTGEILSDLRERVAVAALVKAELVSSEVSPPQSRLEWAREALNDPLGKVGFLLNYMLAVDNAATVAAITGVSDAALQTRVNTAVDKLFT